jgi:AcrR family transcriptional regulator
MRDPAATRDAILRSARSVFTDFGYQGASMRKIAGQAGVTHAAIYRHFADKDDLLAALADHDFEELIVEVGGRIEPTASALVRLRTLIKGFMTVCVENPRLYEFLFQILPTLPTARTESADAARQAVVTVVSECVVDKLLIGDADELADLIVIAAHGYIARSLARRATGTDTPHIDVYIDFMLSGARAGAIA